MTIKRLIKKAIQVGVPEKEVNVFYDEWRRIKRSMNSNFFNKLLLKCKIETAIKEKSNA